MSDELCEACGKPHNHPNHFSSVQGNEHFFVPSREPAAAPPPANDELRAVAREILGYGDGSRCSLCNAHRIETGACSLIGCKDPGHDYMEELRVMGLLAQVAARARAERIEKYKDLLVWAKKYVDEFDSPVTDPLLRRSYRDCLRNAVKELERGAELQKAVGDAKT